MSDVLTRAQRSFNMSMIRGRDTGPEVILRKALWKSGFRYRNVGGKRLPGRPDIVLTSARIAIFIDGCFWHGCPKHIIWPANNAAFWKKKIRSNKARDQIVTRMLRKQGWYVFRVWEHDVHRRLDHCVKRIETLAGSPSRSV